MRAPTKKRARKTAGEILSVGLNDRVALEARADGSLAANIEGYPVDLGQFSPAAIKRAKAYEAAGVDAVFLAGGVTVAAVEAVSSAIRIPLILGGGGGELGNLEWLAAHRVRVALQTHAPFSAAVQAVYQTLKALREGTQVRDLQNIAPPELMRRVTRAEDYQRWTTDFLGGA